MKAPKVEAKQPQPVALDVDDPLEVGVPIKKNERPQKKAPVVKETAPLQLTQEQEEPKPEPI